MGLQHSEVTEEMLPREGSQRVREAGLRRMLRQASMSGKNSSFSLMQGLGNVIMPQKLQWLQAREQGFEKLSPFRHWATATPREQKIPGVSILYKHWQSGSKCLKIFKESRCGWLEVQAQWSRSTQGNRKRLCIRGGHSVCYLLRA